MATAFLTTVGTSVLTNLKRTVQDFDALSDDALYQQHLRLADWRQASAELNALDQLLKNGDRVILFHSQTKEGTRSAGLLRRMIANRDATAETVELADLRYDVGAFKVRGLRSLVAELVKAIGQERAHGHEVRINATGGFKAESAYATVVGLLAKVPVLYIHELFREVVELPPFPINWDAGLILQHEDFFEWIEADCRATRDVDQRLQGLAPEVRSLLLEEEGYTLLSPAGEVAWQLYRQSLANADVGLLRLSPAAQRTVAGAGGPELKKYQKLLRLLCVDEHRRVQAHQPRGTNLLSYPNTNTAERALFHEVDGTIYVYAIGDHDEVYDLVPTAPPLSDLPLAEYRPYQPPMRS